MVRYFSVFSLFNPLNPPYQGDFKRKCVSPDKLKLAVSTRSRYRVSLVLKGKVVLRIVKFGLFQIDCVRGHFC